MNTERIIIYTIGHSNRSLEEFLSLLSAHHIECIADVRQKPTSKGWPHFAADNLIRELTSRRIGYCWFPSLGGNRTKGLGRRSPNKAWKSTDMRNYADYTLTTDFTKALRTLLTLAKKQRTAIMCAEIKWRRCHRRLIADHLYSEGIEVLHITDAGPPHKHSLPRFGHIKRSKLSYHR